MKLPSPDPGENADPILPLINVVFLLLIFFMVTTKISKIRKPRLDAPTPKAWARAAVKQIGYETDRTPYWSHGLMLMFIKSVGPVWAVNAFVTSLHKGMRKRFYKKYPTGKKTD